MLKNNLLTPAFSIILPTYNRAHHIEKAIQSIVNQSYSDWELIIIDDGSTDNTKEVVEKYTSKDQRIRYIFQKNAERCVARNNGIAKAKGQYILFLDSDDEFEKDNLKNWNSFWVQNSDDGDFAYGDMKTVSKAEENIVQGQKVIGNPFNFIFTNPIVPGRVCIKREVLTHDCLFDPLLTVGEDVALWLKCAQHSPLLYSSHTCLIYYIHESNTVAEGTDAPLKMYKGFQNYFKKEKKVREQIDNYVYKSYTSKILTNCAKYFFHKEERFKAVKYLLKAIICSPFHEHTKYRVYLIWKALTTPKGKLHEQV